MTQCVLVGIEEYSFAVVVAGASVRVQREDVRANDSLYVEVSGLGGIQRRCEAKDRHVGIGCLMEKARYLSTLQNVDKECSADSSQSESARSAIRSHLRI